MLTVVIANYKRPTNIDKITANLPAWAKLFILDNTHGKEKLSPETLKRADWFLDSSCNFLQLRWVMAGQAATPYYVIHDDDLMLPTESYERYVRHMQDAREENVRMVTGPFGVTLNYNNDYVIRAKHKHNHGDRVHLIKGRMVFGATQYLQQIPACPPGVDGNADESVISEDIYVSSQFAHKYGTLFTITDFGDVVELPAPHPSSGSLRHYRRRRNYCKKAFAGIDYAR